MKKITLSFSILAASVALFITGCKKTKPEAPVADTELQSSIDATFALFTVTDVEMIGSFITDNSTAAPAFYASAGTNTSIAVNDTLSDQAGYVFNDNLCLDGRFRHGSVVVDRARFIPGTTTPYNQYSTPNSRYYHTVGYEERLTLSEYKVDDWRVVTTNATNNNEGDPCIVTSQLTTDHYDTQTTKLSWTIKGGFKMKKGTDSMFIYLDVVKTLENTKDATVFPPSKNNPINWIKAKVSYSGHLFGVTINGAPFTMTVTPEQAIIRDFTCTPDLVSSVVPTSTVGVVNQQTSQYHPFIDGIAGFTTAKLYPRQIYYAGSEVSATPPCDNSGAVLIKGISYPIDFRKQ